MSVINKVFCESIVHGIHSSTAAYECSTFNLMFIVESNTF